MIAEGWRKREHFHCMLCQCYQEFWSLSITVRASSSFDTCKLIGRERDCGYFLHLSQRGIESNHSFGTCHLSITQEYAPMGSALIFPQQRKLDNQSHFQGMAEDALAEKISMISVPQVWDSTWLPLYTPVCVVIPSCFKHVCGLFVQLVALGVVMASSRPHFWMMPSTVQFITLRSMTAWFLKGREQKKSHL